MPRWAWAIGIFLALWLLATVVTDAKDCYRVNSATGGGDTFCPDDEYGGYTPTN